MKRIITVKTSKNLLFGCHDNLKNFAVAVASGFQKFAFSVKTICPHHNDIITIISFSNLATLESVVKGDRFQ